MVNCGEIVANHKENEAPRGDYEAYRKAGILLFKKREYKYDQRLLLAYMGNAIMKMLCAINIWQ